MLREGENQNADDVSALTTAMTVPTPRTQEIQNQNSDQQNNPVQLNNVSQAISRRHLGAYYTGSRKRVVSQILAKVHVEIKECKAKLDSHADTCHVNNVTRILEYYGQVAEVSGFANSLDPIQDVPIVNAAVAYDNPQTGEMI
jgi:hypothetical protein